MKLCNYVRRIPTRIGSLLFAVWLLTFFTGSNETTYLFLFTRQMYVLPAKSSRENCILQPVRRKLPLLCRKLFSSWPRAILSRASRDLVNLDARRKELIRCQLTTAILRSKLSRQLAQLACNMLAHFPGSAFFPLVFFKKK